tara:strand:+ start:1341 stop:1676 length:336 start_codon:yes stop_codon:yes gene_type:complete
MTESESKAKPGWVKLSSKEIEALIVDLGKKGISSEKIGLILRDKHGIPKVKPLLNKRISEILEENDVETKSQIDHINEKIEKIKVHVTKNKQDYTASKSLTKKLWALQKAQ